MNSSSVTFGAVREGKPQSSGRVRHVGMTLFLMSSLLVGSSIGPLESIERGSLRYWLLVSPAALLPLLNISAIAHALGTRAGLLLLFLFTAGVWHLYQGDSRAVLQLGLLVLVLAWVSTDRAALNVRDLVWIYLMLVALGVGVNIFTDLNPYGLFPGQADRDFGSLRVSFFPNVANTGLLSLAMFLILTKDSETACAHPYALATAIYFLVFSFLRSAFIGAVIYLVLRWWFGTYCAARPVRMFWTTILVAVGCITLIWFSSDILYRAQQLPFISMFLLKGEGHLTTDEIEYQQYRPWLWNEQFKLFATSPWLMGLGSYDFYAVVSSQLEDPDSRIISAGAEAMPTRLLTVYGVPGTLLTLYLVSCMRVRARHDDRWACACFPALFLLMMSWGNAFHPTDAMFVLFLLIVTRGAAAFTATDIRGPPASRVQ